MKHNGKFNIATGLSINSKSWKNKKVSWNWLVEKLLTAYHTNETQKEYFASTKSEKTKIKDVGGYIGAVLQKGKRGKRDIITKQLLTLDVDYAHENFWSDFKLQFENAAVIHVTHSHTKISPRYRLIMPLSRECSPDEYVAVARKIAGSLNIELFDNTTFEINRFMFWPSVPKDVEYEADFQDGVWIDVDETLQQYEDWTDSTQWPISSRNLQEVRTLSKKQQDPEFKRGLIGAFCRTYSIQEAISTYLEDVYKEEENNRYTYIKGSTAAGLICYDGKFAYSHHGTDPISGMLCNAFDLVRVHRFIHLDEGSKEKIPNRMKSFKAMEELVKEDPKVKRIIALENVAEINYDFAEDYEDEVPEITTENLEWAEKLEVDGRGKYLSNSSNINLIFQNDVRLKNIFKYNKFDYKYYVFRSLPWRKIKKPEPIKNVDFAGIRNYLESAYGITGRLKVDDSLALEFEKHSFHPVKEYLESLEWDGVERVDTVLIDYFGVEDNIYAREAIRKTLVGAVARIFQPGVKFDLVLTLVGEQGTGKSTLANKLGGEWYSDSFQTVKGKEAFEQLQGAWIIELAELSALRKAEIESVKHYISKQVDTYRPAYGRGNESYPRQCIFIGSTNKWSFLNDPTGNRRFIPVDVRPQYATKNIFELNKLDVAQLWGEAVAMYNKGEKLYMSDEAEIIARQEQKDHSEHDERKGVIEAYLDTELPSDWDELDLYSRKQYFQDELTPNGTEQRKYVCVGEIWVECLGNDKAAMSRYNTREINEILRSLDNWEFKKSPKNFKIYGKQRYYKRKYSEPILE